MVDGYKIQVVVWKRAKVMTADEIIILDVETWTDVGARDRDWRGMQDFPPLLIQIAAAKVRFTRDAVKVVDWFEQIVWPSDEFGNKVPINHFLTSLTGITKKRVLDDGVSVQEAVSRFSRFCGDRNIFSYGNDVQNRFLISCYASNLKVPIEPTKSFDIKRIFHRAGLSEDFLLKTNSGKLCKALGIPVNIREHDARQDVISLLEVIKYLRSNYTLNVNWLLDPGNPREHLTDYPGGVEKSMCEPVQKPLQQTRVKTLRDDGDDVNHKGFIMLRFTLFMVILCAGLLLIFKNLYVVYLELLKFDWSTITIDSDKFLIWFIIAGMVFIVVDLLVSRFRRGK